MIDIIVPTYNSQDTIDKCLHSILKINSVYYNIILIDDGSSDNTPKINDMYSIKYSNVYSFHQCNKGVSEARNNGICHAHSKWICFVDSDDYINANNFVRVVKRYLLPKNDLIVSSINFNGKNIKLNNHDGISNSVYRFIKLNYPLYGNELIHVSWNKIYKTSIIKQNHIYFPKKIEMGEDLIFVLTYLMYIHKNVISTSIIYYNYFLHNYSATKSFEKYSMESRILILDSIKSIYDKYNLSFNVFNKLCIKSIYSILLNGLNKPNDKIFYLQCKKYNIISLNCYKEFIYEYYKINKNIEDRILTFFFKQKSILILFCFLYFIDMIRFINIKIKFYL